MLYSKLRIFTRWDYLSNIRLSYLSTYYHNCILCIKCLFEIFYYMSQLYNFEWVLFWKSNPLSCVPILNIAYRLNYKSIQLHTHSDYVCPVDRPKLFAFVHKYSGRWALCLPVATPLCVRIYVVSYIIISFS